MKYLFTLLLFCLLVPSASWAVTVTDNFTGTDGAALAGDWQAGYTASDACEIFSNRVRLPAASTAGICVEAWGANGFTGDQAAQVTLTTWQGSIAGTANIFLKITASTSVRTWYRCDVQLNSGTIRTQIQKRVADATVDTLAENTTTWSAGDVFKCTATGTTTVTVKAYKNGTPVLTYTDSSSPLSGILIGIGVGSTLGGSLAEIEIDDFSGGDFSAPTPIVHRRMVLQ